MCGVQKRAYSLQSLGLTPIYCTITSNKILQILQTKLENLHKKTRRCKALSDFCYARSVKLPVRFREPVKAPAPGQSAVFYDDEDRVIGGGIIVK